MYYVTMTTTLYPSLPAFSFSNNSSYTLTYDVFGMSQSVNPTLINALIHLLSLNSDQQASSLAEQPL